MAGNERIGASFGIDITALKTGLQQANRLIKESNSEFKAAAAGMDDWTKSEEGLTAKIKNLNEVADLQSKKINAMQKEYEKCIADGLDPMSAAAVKMRTDINNEKAAFEKTQSEIKKYSQKLDELSGASDDAGDNMEELGDSAKEASDGFTIAKGAIADLISNGIQALAGAAKNAISSIAGLAESTRESRTAFAKLEQSFDSAGLGAEAAQKTMTDLYGVLGDTDKATEASNLIAKMSKNQEDLDKNTRILTGVFAEYGDSIPTEGLAEGMQATAQMGTVQGVLADALEWQGINLDEYNEKLGTMSSAEERAAYIQETLTGLYGESADSYRENNKALIEANEAQLEYDKTMNAFGDKIEPITTKVKEGFNKILEKVLELVEGVDLDAFGEKIEKAFDVFINDVIPKVIDGFNWIKDNGDTIIAILAGIAAGFAAFKVATMIMSVVGAIKKAGGALALLNTTMLASPITWIAVGVAALVAGIVLLIKNWDEVKEVAVACWNKIKVVWGKVADWFKKNVVTPIADFFNGLWNGVKSVFSSVVDWIKENWQSMLLFLVNPVAGIFKYLYDNVEGFRNFIDGVVQAITGFFKKLWEDVSGFFVNLWNDIVNAYHTVIDPWIEIFKRLASIIDENVIQPIIQFFRGLWQSVSGFFSNLWNDIVAIWTTVATWFNTNVIQPLVGFFTALWQSISQAASNAWNAIVGVFTSVATWFSEKVIQPVKNAFTSLWDTAKNGATKAWDGIKSVFSKVADFFGSIFKTAWEKVKAVFSVGGKIFDGIKDGIVTAFKTVVNAIISGINKVVAVPFNGLNTVLNKISTLDILGIKPFKWLTWRAPVPEIPLLAKGGVVREATNAIIGEDGAEAVVPLEKNTEWIDKVADKLASKQPKSVVVNQTNNYSQAHSRYELYKSKQATAAAVRMALQGV